MMVSAMWLALSVAHAGVPVHLSHQGRLVDGTGHGLEGAHDLTVSVYAGAGAASPAWSEQYAAQDFAGGTFQVVLGATSGNVLDSDLLASGDLWVGHSVDGVDVGLRTPITSAPYALVATTASAVSGGAVHADTLTVGATPLVDSLGTWVGPTAGLAGPSGPAGAQGPPGPAGATGAQGLTGLQGPTGDQGPRGGQGGVGPAGFTGSAGPAGSTGGTGSAGPTYGCVFAGSCPAGYTWRGTMGIILQGSCPGSVGALYTTGWPWCHMSVCCKL